MCKYNQYHYWEDLLANKKDLWKSSFAPITTARETLFINTAIIDYQRNTLDNNWACYPDAKSVLGFIQYVQLPLAFFYTLNASEEALAFPVCSSQEFIEYLQESGSIHTPAMESAVLELSTYWDLDSVTCLEKLKDFCQRFNAFWDRDTSVLHIDVFENTYEIAHCLLDKSEFPEVMEEDIGLTAVQLFEMCKNFYHDQFLQKNFVNILNHKIGCVV
ncbi:hypothetical protein [Anaerospora sp.]|uniref:hypothetical protein n=1 Tax=Anaerospora sp. TaxID=1960278 RepID=UPI00289A89D5|nr:hypothetical protein [Anaerospora sp.]